MTTHDPCADCGHGICQCYICPACWGVNTCDIGYCEERDEDVHADETHIE